MRAAPGKVEGQIAHRHAEDGAANDRADAVAVIDIAGKERLDAQVSAQ